MGSPVICIGNGDNLSPDNWNLCDNDEAKII